jgi:hypothetical protein
MSDASGTYELRLDELSMSVPTAAILAKCGSFAATHPSPYSVRSNVSPSALGALVNAIHGVAINITLENVADLTLLADEFSFGQLQCELSVWSLSTILESEGRYFLSELDNRQPPLARLVSLGFDESASRTMLILTRGNFKEALASLETVNRDASRLSLFASSIPIHMCPQSSADLANHICVPGTRSAWRQNCAGSTCWLCLFVNSPGCDRVHGDHRTG